MLVYKKISRYYFETYDQNEEPKIAYFIARGQWADGHLAYTRYDEYGYECDEECSYVQLRGIINGKSCLYMQRI